MRIKKLYINLEAGLFIETSFSTGKFRLMSVGKKVKIETCEMGTVIIGGKYYTLGVPQGALIEIKEVV